MRFNRLLLLFSLCSLHGAAQDDHLEPRGTYGVYGGVLFNYFTNDLFQNLETSLDDTLLRFMMLPEFEPEKSFFLQKEDSDYTIHVHHMTVNNLLGAEEYRKIVTMGLYHVDNTFAEKLTKLFRAALEQTGFSAQQQVDHDGTLYLFTAKDQDGIARYAEKWTPVQGAHISELVSICSGIIECDESLSPTRKEQLAKIETRIDSLVSAFENSDLVISSDRANPAFRQTYDIQRTMNARGDTITAVKTAEIINSINHSVQVTGILVQDNYVKESPGSMYWKNTRTGKQNIEFIPDKDRGKNLYYARKRYRILDLR